MSLQELKYVPFEVLDVYLSLLHKQPMITKSVTSAVLGGLGDVIYQVVTKKNLRKNISYRSVASFAGCGLLVTGPMTHHFIELLDILIPRRSKFGPIKRLLVDRLLFAPVYLLILLYFRCILDGLNHRAAKQRILRTYWPILKMSFRVWTIVQYVNLNHVPKQYRVLFANVISLGWNVYMAAVRLESSKK